MHPISSFQLRRRLLWTAVLVLVALGGAGLATAADRPPTDELRPELYARADLHAAAWLQGISAQLHPVESGVTELASVSREVLATLQQLDPAALGELIATGDETAGQLEVAAVLLADMREDAPAGLDETRMSRANRELLAGADRVLDAVLPLGATWRSLARTTRQLSSLLVAVFQHESLVFRATSAARQERWQQALDLLDEGRTKLAVASEVRDQLADPNHSTTLDDLLSRYVAYSDALTNLYTMLRDGAAIDSPEVVGLLAVVEEAQGALPDDTGALRVVVSEIGGTTVAEATLALERARGVVAQVAAGLP